MLRPFRTFPTIWAVTSEEINRALSELYALTEINVSPPLNLSRDGAGYHLRLDPADIGTALTQITITSTTVTNLNTTNLNTTTLTVDELILVLNSTVSLSSNTNNLNITLTSGSKVPVNCSAVSVLTGIVAPSPAAAVVLYLINEGTQPFYLTHNDSGSTAANRFYTPNGLPVAVTPTAYGNSQEVMIEYDPDLSVWLVLDVSAYFFIDVALTGKQCGSLYGLVTGSTLNVGFAVNFYTDSAGTNHQLDTSKCSILNDLSASGGMAANSQFTVYGTDVGSVSLHTIFSGKYDHATNSIAFAIGASPTVGVSLVVPTGSTADVQLHGSNYIWPTGTGSNGQMLTTDGNSPAGLTWTSAGTGNNKLLYAATTVSQTVNNPASLVAFNNISYTIPANTYSGTAGKESIRVRMAGLISFTGTAGNDTTFEIVLAFAGTDILHWLLRMRSDNTAVGGTTGPWWAECDVIDSGSGTLQVQGFASHVGAAASPYSPWAEVNPGTLQQSYQPRLHGHVGFKGVSGLTFSSGMAVTVSVTISSNMGTDGSIDLRSLTLNLEK